MWSPASDHDTIETDLAVARRRARALAPFSPAWDAAMTLVEDLERDLWRLDHPTPLDQLDDARLSPAVA